VPKAGPAPVHHSKQQQVTESSTEKWGFEEIISKSRNHHLSHHRLIIIKIINAAQITWSLQTEPYFTVAQINS